jgi:hypothetical protein
VNYVQGDEHACTNHTEGVNKNIFFTGKKDTGDSQNNSDKLKPGGMMKIV